MVRNLFVIGACLLLSAQPAFAQTAAPASPDTVASAKVRADAIIAAAGVSDLFQNVTDGPAPKVKHTASGLACTFHLNSPVSRITLFPNPVRGNDVGCTEKMNDALVTLYATKVTPAHNLRRDFMQAMDTIKAVYPDMEPYRGLTATANKDTFPANETAIVRFIDKEGRITGKPGTVVLSRLSMAIVGDAWELKMRASTPEPQDQAAREQAGTAFSFITSLPWVNALTPFAKAPEKQPAL